LVPRSLRKLTCPKRPFAQEIGPDFSSPSDVQQKIREFGRFTERIAFD